MVGRKPGYMKAASTCNKPGCFWDGIALQIVYLKSEINEKLHTVKEYDKQNYLQSHRGPYLVICQSVTANKNISFRSTKIHAFHNIFYCLTRSLDNEKQQDKMVIIKDRKAIIPFDICTEINALKLIARLLLCKGTCQKEKISCNGNSKPTIGKEKIKTAVIKRRKKYVQEHLLFPFLKYSSQLNLFMWLYMQLSSRVGTVFIHWSQIH